MTNVADAPYNWKPGDMVCHHRGFYGSIIRNGQVQDDDCIAIASNSWGIILGHRDVTYLSEDRGERVLVVRFTSYDIAFSMKNVIPFIGRGMPEVEII